MNYLILLSTFIINIGEIFCAHRIIKKKLNFKSIRLYLGYIVMVLLTYLNYIFSDNIYKVILTLFISILVVKILFNYNLKKSIITAILMQIYTIAAELIFAVIVVLFSNIDNQTFAKIYQGTIFSNALICLNLILISLSNIPNYFYKKICKYTSRVSLNKIIIFLGFVLLCSSLLFYISYYNKNNFLNLIVNFLIVTVYFIIVIMIMKKENNYNRVYSKYITMVEELKEYENIINEYRIINHENKNQLLSIKGMTKNKKINDYIDEMINNKSSNNKKLLDQALLIPTGGLRGLIYSKLVQMKDKNISYSLNVDKKINNSLMKKINSKEMIDICQIVGVFLDNSIEAVEDLDNKVIVVNIYNADNLIIEVINNYRNNIKINKIDKVGYTTKGGNHGYGLALVNKLISKNKNFSNEREVSKSLFKQKLIIKM